MFPSLLQLLQTPRFLLAMSLSTVTAGAVAGPLAVQAIRSDSTVVAQVAEPTSPTIDAVVKGSTTIAADPSAGASASSEIAAPERADDSTSSLGADPLVDPDATVDSRPTTPPSTRSPNVAPDTTRPAPTPSSTTAAPATVTTAPDPGPVAPTVTKPSTPVRPKPTVDTTPATTVITSDPEPSTTTATILRPAPPDSSVSTAEPVVTVNPTGVLDTTKPATIDPVTTTERPTDKTNNGRGQDGERDENNNEVDDANDGSWWDDILDAISGNN